MRADDFLRALRRFATARSLTLGERQGRGSHLVVTLNGRMSVIPMHRGDMPTGTFRAVLKQLGSNPKTWRVEMGFAWPVDVVAEEGGFSVSFPDVPGAITWGVTREEALVQAEDALVSLIATLIEDGQPIPVASDFRGRPVVAVAPLDAAKMALHMAMIERGTSNVELGRRLGLTEKAVRRLVDPLHHSRIEKVDAALRVLGKRLEISVLEVS